MVDSIQTYASTPKPRRLTQRTDAERDTESITACCPAAALDPGYWFRALQAVEVLDDKGNVLPAREAELGMRINRMLVKTSTWESVLDVVRDTGHLFDKVNVATSMHRMARKMREARVRPLLVQN